jgi:hypothetical protein
MIGIVAGGLAIFSYSAKHYFKRRQLQARLRAKQAEADRANAEAQDLRRQLEGGRK